MPIAVAAARHEQPGMRVEQQITIATDAVLTDPPVVSKVRLLHIARSWHDDAEASLATKVVHPKELHRVVANIDQREWHLHWSAQ